MMGGQYNRRHVTRRYQLALAATHLRRCAQGNARSIGHVRSLSRPASLTASEFQDVAYAEHRGIGNRLRHTGIEDITPPGLDDVLNAGSRRFIGWQPRRISWGNAEG
jgi:hypothetical protein